MFTGIVESLATLVRIEQNQSNLDLWFSTPLVGELKINQSVAHNGVCLTVVDIKDNWYKVTAIAETLQKTNLGQLKLNDLVNIERSLIWGGRLDGHIVQGHVDCTAQCVEINHRNGSWEFGFEYLPQKNLITVPKGSICINGVSLTVIESKMGYLSVGIIPYTYENTNFKQLKVGEYVNLEFDIIGKYIFSFLDAYKQVIK